MTSKPLFKPYRKQILVCTGPRCAPETSGDLYTHLKKRLVERGLYNADSKRISRVQCQCFGVCTAGPIVGIQPDGVWYHSITPEKLERILTEHIEGGNPIAEYTLYENKSPS
jgi:(2Fe-2S) ferredoxin